VRHKKRAGLPWWAHHFPFRKMPYLKDCPAKKSLIFRRSRHMAQCANNHSAFSSTPFFFQTCSRKSVISMV
jgi:hypothetical protein